MKFIIRHMQIERRIQRYKCLSLLKLYSLQRQSFVYRVVDIPKTNYSCGIFSSVSFVQSHSCIHEFLWMIINKWTRASRNWTNERRTIIFTYEKKNLRMIFFFFDSFNSTTYFNLIFSDQYKKKIMLQVLLFASSLTFFWRSKW